MPAANQTPDSSDKSENNDSEIVAAPGGQGRARNLKKPNEAIGMIPFHLGLKLSVQSHRLYSAILLVSQKQGVQDRYHSRFSEIKAAGNIKETNVSRLKTYCSELARFRTQHQYIDDFGKSMWADFGLIDLPEISHDTGEVSWVLAKPIQNRLIDPKSFFTYLNLKTTTKFKTYPALSLYEICCQYETFNRDSTGHGYTPKFPVFELVQKIVGEKLEGTTLKENPKREWRYFWRDCLKRAIAEVTELGQIEVKEILSTRGREVTHCQFRIKRITAAVDAVLKDGKTQTSAASKEISARIAKTGVSETEAADLAAAYVDRLEYIAEKIGIVESKLARGAAISSPSAFLKDALKKDYKPYAPSPIQLSLIRPSESQVSLPQVSTQETESQKVSTLRKNALFDEFELKPNSEQKDIVSRYLDGCAPDIRRWYERKGFAARVVKESFKLYLDNTTKPGST